MPAGVRGEPGVEKIRHYRNADGKLLVDITRSLRASERSKAAPLANLRGGPCVVPAGITWPVVFFHGSERTKAIYRSDDASLVCDFSVWWECLLRRFHHDGC